MTSAIKAVIFDADGLLLDSEIHLNTIVEEILGSPLPPDIKASMLGRKPQESAKVFSQFAATQGIQISPEEYLEKREPRLQELFPNTDLMPGAAKLVTHLHQNNIPIAIATSSLQRYLDLKFSQHRPIQNLFNCIVTGEEVKHGKPHPDLFLKAAQCLNIEPPHCLVFEDALNGIQAAKAANMPLIAVPDHHLDHALLEDADQILNSLEEFKPEDWNLPAY